jgi:hypothetical protein
MFHPTGEDNFAFGIKWKATGKFVNGFGRVLAKDAGMILGISPNESQYYLAGLFIDMGGKLALEPGAAMDTAVINQKVVHGFLDGIHWGGGGGIIQIGITTTATIKYRNEGIQAEEEWAIVIERLVGHLDFLFI